MQLSRWLPFFHRILCFCCIVCFVFIGQWIPNGFLCVFPLKRKSQRTSNNWAQHRICQFVLLEAFSVSSVHGIPPALTIIHALVSSLKTIQTCFLERKSSCHLWSRERSIWATCCVARTLFFFSRQFWRYELQNIYIYIHTYQCLRKSPWRSRIPLHAPRTNAAGELPRKNSWQMRQPSTQLECLG